MKSKKGVRGPTIQLGDAANIISRQSLTSAVAGVLREKILQGEIGEGRQLRQHEIARELRVSRTPVREALRQLEAEGLVKIVDHYGAMVAALSLEEIEELFEIRAVLESCVLGYAIANLKEEDYIRAEKIQRDFEAALHREADVSTWGELNLQFHLTLYGAAARPRFLDLIETLHNKSDRYVRIHLHRPDERLVTVEEHRALLGFCRSRDAASACSLANQHIMRAARSLIDYLRAERHEA